MAEHLPIVRFIARRVHERLPQHVPVWLAKALLQRDRVQLRYPRKKNRTALALAYRARS
jgi:hypothetical protein